MEGSDLSIEFSDCLAVDSQPFEFTKNPGQFLPNWFSAMTCEGRLHQQSAPRNSGLMLMSLNRLV